jgi:hypothetical protein
MGDVRAVLLIGGALVGCGSTAAHGAPSDAGAVDSGPDTGSDATGLDSGTDGGRLFAPGPARQLSPGNATGQDEDPSIVVADGTLYVAWYSNRNSQAGRPQDKQIFFMRSTDGVTWTDPPTAVTEGASWAFYPSLAPDSLGGLHLAWWQLTPLPAGCTPGVDCTGSDNRILYKHSSNGVDWDPGPGTEVTPGPGDWLPSLVVDGSGRVRIYFAAVARGADGQLDLGETTTHVYVTTLESTGWSPASRVTGIESSAFHDSYPMVAQGTDGTFLMTWTRYDAAAPSDVLQVVSEPSTDTMFATSADGTAWSTPQTMSGGAGEVDVFPWLYADHAGAFWLTWKTAASSVAQLEVPTTGSFADAVVRPELTGYSAKILALPVADLYWGVWVDGSDPTQKIAMQFFEK